MSVKGGFIGDGTDDHIVNAIIRQLKGIGFVSERAMRSPNNAGLDRSQLAPNKVAANIITDGLAHSNSEMLAATPAQEAVASLECAERRSFTFWRTKQQEWAARFDSTEAAPEDENMFLEFKHISANVARKRAPALRLVPFTHRQKQRFSNLAWSLLSKRRADFLASRERVVPEVKRQRRSSLPKSARDS